MDLTGQKTDVLRMAEIPEREDWYLLHISSLGQIIQMDLNGFKWIQINSNEFNWIQMDANLLRQDEIPETLLMGE